MQFLSLSAGTARHTSDMTQILAPGYISDFTTYQEENVADAGMGFSLLVPLDNNNKNNEEF